MRREKKGRMRNEERERERERERRGSTDHFEGVLLRRGANEEKGFGSNHIFADPYITASRAPTHSLDSHTYVSQRIVILYDGVSVLRQYVPHLIC